MKKQPHFTARLPVLLSHQMRYVSKKAYMLLPENERGTSNGRGCTNYFHNLPPYPNPFVEKLRKKLNGKRVKYSERTELIEGVLFIHFSTIEVAL